MGSVLNRKKVKLNSDGTSVFDYSIPTLTVSGTRDGFSRISR